MKVLIIFDLWDRRSPRLEANSSIRGEGVVRLLELLRLRGECPKHLRNANGRSSRERPWIVGNQRRDAIGVRPARQAH